MKKFAILLAAGVAMSAASTAMAGFSTGVQAGPLNSNGPAGDALNGVYTFNYAGPAFLPGSFRFSGDLTSGGIGSWATEARWRVTAPSGEIFTMSAGLPGSVTGSFTSTNFSNVTVNTAGALSGVANSVGTWTFNAFESFNDGGASVDATWSNFSFDFDDFVPPTPPTAFNLGNLAPGGMVMGQNAYVANTVQWYKVTLGAAIPAGELFRVHTAGNTLVGNSFGDGDTEIALFDSLGNVIASNDDQGGFRWSKIDITTGMAAGDYYIAAAAYDLSFGTGWTASASDAGTVTGDMKITVIPAPGSLALLGLGGLIGLRRRRA